MRKHLLLILLLSTASILHAQNFRVYGIVTNADNKKPIEGATVFVQLLNVFVETSSDGTYALTLPKGNHKIEAFKLNKETSSNEVSLNSDLEVNFALSQISGMLADVEVVDTRSTITGMARLRAIDGLGIYEAKKNELILLDDFAANKVSNNARQVFAKVPGLNIWESDFAGLQLDIAARGLGPSRTANFNTRQNGYDMSADALGYPESYYLPAIQAVDRIEVVRGAASLQYGTQFGGMMNFKLKEAPEKPFELNLEQAVGSFGLLNSFGSIGGTIDKLDYYGYYQKRSGDGWRENSGFDSDQAFGRIGYQVSNDLKLGFEYSFLNYQAQQPGGLTDEDFRRGNLRQSRRGRNWFQVNWNLYANTIDYQVSDQTKLNVRSFFLNSDRSALGNLEQIDRVDNPSQNRTLIADQFRNFGSEARLLSYFELFGQRSAFLIGGRYYNGMTDRQQGNANTTSDADFFLINPTDPEDFDFDFPSSNLAFFAETVINLSDKLSVTPGIRYENITTDAEGTWKQTVRDFAGNISAINVFQEERSVQRSFVLLGIGASYYLNDDLNAYANFSENFRSVTFSDLRLNNPNFILDSLITDESGYNADLGVRGSINEWLTTDISLFYLQYNDRIGVLLPPSSTILFRTNVGDTRHYGLESYAEADVLRLLGIQASEAKLSLFTNLSWINATYIRSKDPAIAGNRVEYVPNLMFRSGLNFKRKDFKASYQFSFLGDQFSDATNSLRNPNALTGLIPSYYVMDVSAEYTPGKYKFTAGINNLTNEQYFTRRAESYPGPGIIPATIRSFYFSMGYTF